MSAISATFSDFKLVRTRKVAQLVMEIPIEHADQALMTLGGVPQASTETWVGIARIEEQAVADKAKQTKSWSELSYSQQAGIRCNDPAFQAWLKVDSAEAAAEQVRKFCSCESRSLLDSFRQCGNRWAEMDHDFIHRSMG